MSERIVNLAYYKRSDWARFLSLADDSSTLHDTWDEWYDQFLLTKKQLGSQGLLVNEVTIDLDALIRFCFQQGIKNDGQARSRYVSQIRI